MKTFFTCLFGICIVISTFANSTTVSRYSRPTLTLIWTGNNNTDWTNTGNWDLGATPTGSDNVVIPPVHNQPVIPASAIVTVHDLTIQVSSRLNISAGASLTAYGTITINSGGAIFGDYSQITGTITLQQDIIAQRGWRIFSNPFTDAGGMNIATVAINNSITINTTPQESGMTDSRLFDNGTNTWSNVTAASWASNIPYALFIRGLATDLPGGTGLTYTTGPTGFTYSVSGTINKATVTIPPLNSSNYSLIGNPYAGGVNTIALTGGISLPYYVYKIYPNGDGRTIAGGWVPVTASNNISTIPVLGVVAVKTAGNFSIATTDINTTPNPLNNMFGVETPITMIELQVEQNAVYQDKLFVRLDPTASLKGTDKNDLQKFYNDNVNVYTISTSDSSRLSVDARNVLTNIPLGFSALPGNYVFKLTNNSLPEGITVYLTDKYLNTKTALAIGDSAAFSVNADPASHGEQRFVLSFSNMPAMATINDQPSFTAHVLGNIISGNRVVVQIAGATTPVTIGVKDLSGRAFGRVNAVNGIQYVDLGNAGKGMLLLQITDGKCTIIEKIMKL